NSHIGKKSGKVSCSHHCIGDSGNQCVLHSHGKKKGKSNDIRIYGYQIFAAECDDEQDDGFCNRWKNINKIFSDSRIDFHHKIGKKSTQKKEKYIQCDMKSGLKFLLESCSHEKSKMSCHIRGEFLNG